MCSFFSVVGSIRIDTLPPIEKRGHPKMPSFFYWWSGCRHRRTPLLSFIFALKSFFNIVKRDIVDAQRLLARVDDQREMVIVQIDRVYEDVDERSALIEIVHRHFTNEIKKGIYLRLG